MRTCLSVGAILALATAAFAQAEAKRIAAIGITRSGSEISVKLAKDAGELNGPRVRVLIIGGLDGTKESVEFATRLAGSWEFQRSHEQVSISFITNAYPSGPSEAQVTFPPSKGFYDASTRPESRYLWRWIGMYGADLVIEVRYHESLAYRISGDPKSIEPLREAFQKEKWISLTAQPDELVGALAQKGVEDLKLIPAIVLEISEWREISKIESVLEAAAKLKKSQAHQELLKRQQHNTIEIAQELSKVYGHDLKQVAYIPALAVIGRLRAAEQFKDTKETKSLQELLEPFRSGNTNPVIKSGSDHSGHLLFAELAKRAEGKDRERWVALCRAAADQIFDKDGKPLKLMPYHNEMSDAVFMATPIICATGKLTGEQKYFDAAVQHFRSMKKLCLREDGLYRHSPLDEAAWGRGNGFPALGLAWALSEFPEDHADFPELKKDFQNHITALLKHQDEFGCWHQVIDKPGSYREFSATCMIAWAMKRGLDRGWLTKEQCQTPLDRAWIAAKHRIGPGGKVVDICTGTGKQKSLRDYYDRPAVWGVDARGGAMALMLATEMMSEK